MSQRNITMTVYAIEAELLDVTTPMDLPSSRYVTGRCIVKAQGGGEFHEWSIDPAKHYLWVGDRITVSVLEDDPTPPQRTRIVVPPPIDRRERP